MPHKHFVYAALRFPFFARGQYRCTAPTRKKNEIQFEFSQPTELMDGRYGEVVELWFDGAWDKPCRAWQLDRLYNHVKSMQPMCQIGVNHTVGKYSEKKGMPKKRYEPKNYRDRDPLRMFPSDFRLWDPNMCREEDRKSTRLNSSHVSISYAV